MEIKVIKTEEDYKNAIKLLEKLRNPQNKKEKNDLEVLSILIEKYEDEHFPIELPTPIEAIKFRMEQQGLGINDLGNILGYLSRASEILNKKRKLNLNMIRKLTAKLKIPSSILIQPY